MATYCKVMVDIEHDLSLHKDCIYKVHANWQGPQLACIALRPADRACQISTVHIKAVRFVPMSLEFSSSAVVLCLMG